MNSAWVINVKHTGGSHNNWNTCICNVFL